MAVPRVGQGDGSVAFINSNDARQVDRLGGAAGGDAWGGSLWFRTALGVGVSGGGVISVANPFGRAMFVGRMYVYTTTKSTGASTVDFGVAANGTTSADTLLDGVDLGTAVGVFSNVDDKGTNGKGRQLLGATQFVTGSQATGAVAGLVGFAYIEFFDP